MARRNTRKPIDKLTGVHKQLYLKYSFSEEFVARKEGNKLLQQKINDLMLSYFYECQEQNYVPNETVIESEGEHAFEIAMRDFVITDIDPERFEAANLHAMISTGRYEVAFRQRLEEEKDSDKVPIAVQVILSIDCKPLSQNETNYLIGFLKADYDAELDGLTCKLTDIVAAEPPSKHHKDKLLRISKNNALMTLSQQLEDEGNNDFPYKPSRVQRLKHAFELWTL
ncbi:hypothetical protein AB4254_11395 [Vibrio breoganii]